MEKYTELALRTIINKWDRINNYHLLDRIYSLNYTYHNLVINDTYNLEFRNNTNKAYLVLSLERTPVFYELSNQNIDRITIFNREEDKYNIEYTYLNDKVLKKHL